MRTPKVKVGEREAQDREVPLLELTKDRVVSFSGVDDRRNANVQGAGNDNVNKGVNDVAKAGQAERGNRIVDIRGIEIVANEEIQAIVADQPKKIKKKRKVTDGAGGSGYPSKKLREDHGTSGDAGASVAGKSLVALQGLLKRNTLAAEVGVTAAATVPFVMSFVTPTPKHEGGGGEDYAIGPIIRTQPALERFVVVQATPPVLNMAVTTTVVLGATSVPVYDLSVGQVNLSIFKDSASLTTTKADVAGPSQPVGTDLSAGSFYISQDMDAETLKQVYISKWNVINDSVLDDPDVCRGMIDHLAPPGFFSQLRAIDYEQVLVEYSVGVARQACCSVKVRMRLEHELRGRRKLKERHAQQAAEATRITEINSLRERNISLEGQVAALEFAVVSIDAEIASSQSQVAKLTHDLSSLQLYCDEFSVNASSLEFEKDKLVDQVSGLEMVLHMDAEFYPRYLTTIAGKRWILSRGLRFVLAKCLASPKYLSAMGEAIGRAIDKGMQDGLTASIKHGRAGRSVADVATFNPSAEGDYVNDINALRDLNFSLLAQLEAQVAHNRVQRVRGDATTCRLSLTDSIIPLVEPLSARNLTSKASSSAVLDTAVTTALSTMFAQTDPVPSVLSTEVPSSPKIIFEEEELDTTPEHALAP
nr:hypothetical protein [Tanacetum cinerariifolium]